MAHHSTRGERALSEPRLLTEKEAAEYLRLPVTEVRKLAFGHVILGTKHRYDRKALDAHLDRLAGLAPQSAANQDDDPEAELARFIADHPNAARTA